MLSQPIQPTLTSKHRSGATEKRGSSCSSSDNNGDGLYRTSSFSSVLFTRRSSAGAGSTTSSSSNINSPFHRPWNHGQGTADLDYCWRGGGWAGRASRDANVDLYEFLKESDLAEYYTALNKNLKVAFLSY